MSTSPDIEALAKIAEQTPQRTRKSLSASDRLAVCYIEKIPKNKIAPLASSTTHREGLLCGLLVYLRTRYEGTPWYLIAGNRLDANPLRFLPQHIAYGSDRPARRKGHQPICTGSLD